MIWPADGVREAVQESGGVPDASVRKGRTGDEDASK